MCGFLETKIFFWKIKELWENRITVFLTDRVISHRLNILQFTNGLRKHKIGLRAENLFLYSYDISNINFEQ